MMSRRDQVRSIITNKGDCKELHKGSAICPKLCVIRRDKCGDALMNCNTMEQVHNILYQEAIAIGIKEGLLTEEEIFELKL